jgi:hypothetical protein
MWMGLMARKKDRVMSYRTEQWAISVARHYEQLALTNGTSKSSLLRTTSRAVGCERLYNKRTLSARSKSTPRSALNKSITH